MRKIRGTLVPNTKWRTWRLSWTMTKLRRVLGVVTCILGACEVVAYISWVLWSHYHHHEVLLGGGEIDEGFRSGYEVVTCVLGARGLVACILGVLWSCLHHCGVLLGGDEIEEGLESGRVCLRSLVNSLLSSQGAARWGFIILNCCLCLLTDARSFFYAHWLNENLIIECAPIQNGCITGGWDLVEVVGRWLRNLNLKWPPLFALSFS